MEIRDSALQPFFDGLKTTFNEALGSVTPSWSQIAMRVESNTETNIFGWMEQLPQFRKWVGTRVFHNIVSNSYTLTNEDFEWSLSVHKNKIDDDVNGIYAPLTQAGGRNAAYFPDTEVFKLINNGFATTYGAAYDGKAFFAADHEWKADENGDATTLNNLSNLALSEDNFWKVRQTLIENLTGGDNPFMTGPIKMLLVVGPSLEQLGTRILTADYNELGGSNISKGKADILVNPLITDDKWVLMVTDNPIMPFIYQVREEITIDDNLGSVDLRETKIIKLMADGRFAFGYSLPVLAIGSTGTA